MSDTIRQALERLLAVIKPKYTDPDEIVAVVRAMAAARTALAAEPPAPAPADHVPDAGNMVAAYGEAEELAQWLEDEAVYYEGLLTEASAKATRAAALLREARPQPVPVAERPWERPGWCDAEGQCWWGRCADDFFSPEWTMATLASIEEFCSDTMPQHCLPHWAIAIPQTPQANTTHPIPTEPPTDD